MKAEVGGEDRREGGGGEGGKAGGEGGNGRGKCPQGVTGGNS